MGQSTNVFDFTLKHLDKGAVRNTVRREDSNILTIQGGLAEGGCLKGVLLALRNQWKTNRLHTLMAQNSVRLVLNLIIESLS